MITTTNYQHHYFFTGVLTWPESGKAVYDASRVSGTIIEETDDENVKAHKEEFNQRAKQEFIQLVDKFLNLVK